MSGYRESSFDPDAGGDTGPPLRPFNKVQWAGVALAGAGICAMLATLAGRFGLGIRDTTDMLPLGTTFCALGTVLINSRRQPGALTPETKRRRLVIVAVGLMVFGAAIITILLFKGA